jgi:AmpE protein
MSLISLLIALAAERTIVSPKWQFDHSFSHFETWIKNKTALLQGTRSQAASLFFALLPALAIYLLLELIDETLVEFLCSTLVLVICLGCQQTRQSFKRYIHAAFRNDLESCDLEQRQLQGGNALESESYGQTLVWLNYQYYAAVMVFFIVFGAPGAVFYRMLVAQLGTNSQVSSEEVPCYEDELEQKIEPSEVSTTGVQQILWWLDWPVVRIVSVGYMFVGHFSRAVPVWISHLLDFETSPRKLLIEVAKAAEESDPENDDCTLEPCLLVRLVKRNVLFILAVLAVLTLAGAVS